MARDDEGWRRRREREDEEEENEKAPSLSQKRSGQQTNNEPISDKPAELLQRAEPLMEQVNNLYGMFLAGVEKVPPVERRKHLDQIMTTLMAIGKPTPALRFQVSNLLSRYAIYTERWDRMLKSIESGDRKRTVNHPSSRDKLPNKK